MIVQATADFDANGLVGELQLKVLPCRISTKDKSNDYCPTIAEGEKRDNILKLLNKYSEAYPVSVTEETPTEETLTEETVSEDAVTTEN